MCGKRTPGARSLVRDNNEEQWRTMPTPCHSFKRAEARPTARPIATAPAWSGRNASMAHVRMMIVYKRFV